MTTRAMSTLAASTIGGAARVAAGVLWLMEGVFKIGAHFGSADIGLVVMSASSNTRVPWYYDPLGAFMTAAPGLFGFVVPALEITLGVLLILGIFTRLTAFASIGNLGLYWTTDQLTPQFPVMLVLSAVVLGLTLSGRFGVDGWLRSRRARATMTAR